VKTGREWKGTGIGMTGTGRDREWQISPFSCSNLYKPLPLLNRVNFNTYWSKVSRNVNSADPEVGQLLLVHDPDGDVTVAFALGDVIRPVLTAHHLCINHNFPC